MKRRAFLRTLTLLGAGHALPMTLIPAAFGATPARFFVSVNADGGWDPTDLIDPKGNTPRSDGRGPVNHYAASAIKSAGNLRYAVYPDGATAPDATNAGHLDTFFQKHYRRLRVINGIDTQTNGHETGRRFVWSGRLEQGFPSVAALAAAPYAEQPMAYISNGGYDFTASLVASVRTSSSATFTSLAYPNSQYADIAARRNEGYLSANADNMVQAARAARLERQQQDETLPLRLQQMQQLEEARSGDVALDGLLTRLPATLSSGLKGQAEVAAAAFASGLAVSANLNLGGFDTHGNHDQSQLSALTRLLEGVDHLWSEVTRHGLQDKVTIVIGSDFGRTPFYNAGAGKDHWNVTSIMAMGAGVSGNLVVGATNGNFEAMKLNASTLQPHSSGITVTPKHVHRALRDMLGVPAQFDAQFPLNVERLPLFG
ncbi:MAG: hypothetical protein RLZZ227_2331 [Pseudomonadota bacterium]|jgi:uncharacterized protein (DUF1501 family)